MDSRLNEVPALRVQQGHVEARDYNQLRLAMLRLGRPLRLPIPKLRHLDLLLDTDAWICADRLLYDLPVVAWTDFQDRGREALHAPIPCTIRIYHAHAELIIPIVLSEANRILREQLAETPSRPA
jgi:hypothetical protein